MKVSSIIRASRVVRRLQPFILCRVAMPMAQQRCLELLVCLVCLLCLCRQSPRALCMCLRGPPWATPDNGGRLLSAIFLATPGCRSGSGHGVYVSMWTADRHGTYKGSNADH